MMRRGNILNLRLKKDERPVKRVFELPFHLIWGGQSKCYLGLPVVLNVEAGHVTIEFSIVALVD